MENNNNKTQYTYKRFKDIASRPLSLENWYQETFFSDFVMEYHSHPQIEIMYCQSGQFDFVYKFDNSTKDTHSVTIGKNTFILVNNGYYHKLANLAPSTKIVNLEFLPRQDSDSDPSSSKLIRQFTVSPERLYPVCPQLQKLIAKDKNFYLFVDSNNVLNTMNEIIRKTTVEDSSEKALSIALLTTKLFIDISHCVSPETHKKTGIIYIDTAMMYINSHFLNKLTVEEIANAANISEVYLQKLFKAEYNKTVHSVITEKRIIQAKYLLEQSNLSIHEISRQCGFGCREQLAYEFQKYENCSPSAYRKLNAVKKVRFFSHYGEKKLSGDES